MHLEGEEVHLQLVSVALLDHLAAALDHLARLFVVKELEVGVRGDQLGLLPQGLAEVD